MKSFSIHMPVTCLRLALAGASRAVIYHCLKESVLMVLLVEKVHADEPSYYRQ